MSTLESKPILLDGKASINQLRKALAQLLAAIGADARTPQEISRRFGIDKTLAWRIARAVREEDPWEALPSIPTRHGFGIFLAALAKHGAPQHHIDAVNAALAAFELFVESHSRDRDTLEAIVAVTARKSSSKRTESIRKQGFQANSAMLGVRALAQSAAVLVAPSAQRGRLDTCVLRGLIQFYRLRSNLPWVLLNRRHWGGGEPHNDAPLMGFEVVDDSPHHSPDSPLIDRFCSTPLPPVSHHFAEPDTVRYMIEPGPVGYSAAANLWTGIINRATAPIAESFPGELGEHGISLLTPSELLIFDLLIHKDLAYQVTLNASVYSTFPGSAQYPQPGSESTQLPVPTEVIDLGLGAPSSPLPEIDRYDELLDLSAARLSARAADFHVYRYRLAYPPIPALAIIRHQLKPA